MKFKTKIIKKIFKYLNQLKKKSILQKKKKSKKIRFSYLLSKNYRIIKQKNQPYK